MLTKTRDILLKTIGGCNIVVVLSMFLTGYCGVLDPTRFPLISVCGLAFPAFAVTTVAFLLFWAFLRPRYMVISVIGLLLSIDLMMDYIPVNTPKEHPEDALKVLSYNILATNPNNVPEGEDNEILDYIISSGADIVCLQEYPPAESTFHEQWKQLHEKYPYSDTLSKDNKNTIAVLSRYPLKDKQRIEFESAGNLAGAFHTTVKGKDITIINCHLETVGLTSDEKDNFHRIVKGNSSRSEVKTESKLLAHKIADSMAKRAPQARAVAEYIHEHKDENIILCGDFNDHPLSYTHRKIASELTDCYRKAGYLPGYSFSYASMYVRIDNIMCSETFTPYECKVDKSVSLSDHYPIFCYLAFKE